MENERDDSVNHQENGNHPRDRDTDSLLPWPRWEARSRQTLRRRPDEELEEILRRQMANLATAVSVVCGADSSTARLVARAAYGFATDRAEKLRQLGLAKYALDELPPSNRNHIREIAAQMNSGCWTRTDLLLQDNSLVQPVVAVAVETVSVYHAIREALHPYGFRVQRVRPDELMSETTQGEAPALVIMDLLEQHEDGIPVALHLVHQQLPVIILCGIPVESARPALMFLSRAFDTETLVTAVFRALR